MIDSTVKRVQRDLTAEERQRLERYRQQIASELPSLAERAREAEATLQTAAAQEPTVSGQLRRAILDCGISFQELAAKLGLQGGEMAEFMVGRQSLDSTAIDRLAALLKQELRPIA